MIIGHMRFIMNNSHTVIIEFISGNIVSRIKVSGNAVNFKAANNGLQFMLRMP